MTRINVVPPEELCWQHLIAEYRELPRIFALVKAVQSKGLGPLNIKIPKTYVLGTGHMLFFYNKGIFLLKRQHSLIRSMQRQGYKPLYLHPNTLIEGLHNHWLEDYQPTEEALALNRARLWERRIIK